jgi:hypothetical protein
VQMLQPELEISNAYAHKLSNSKATKLRNKLNISQNLNFDGKLSINIPNRPFSKLNIR